MNEKKEFDSKNKYVHTCLFIKLWKLTYEYNTFPYLLGFHFFKGLFQVWK